ncbi:putative quercetin 2,3-dioxygenase [Litchfieldella qijiaojingensis]|uniref:Quercetin 2,3-dioxygenase n=1 Tax=Litchfieldella qijiaojingensis TaxID=980347 RepID=A0ABQ2Z4Q6_9GAMM|nr:pirin family protein [Halomonas qijiaojingensis]GGY04943.1 putative quercetin 2,3-dioxygenase [Halomonas qijiaojingensis]
MSNLINDKTLSSSLDCPVVAGKRLIQHIAPRTADVGGIPVNRVLPSRQRRLVGAWCFLDHAGPSVFKGGSAGLRVGPHPHIGLQTFTWMIEGEVLHRDSLGNEQVIRPGQVNLMTAGRGISHTEESVPGESHLHAAQLWIALPEAHRNTEPRFDHYPDLPRWQAQGVELTLLTGEFAGHQAPTLAFSPLMGVDLHGLQSTMLSLPLRNDFEYALLPLEGELEIDGEPFATNELAYLGRGRDSVEVALPEGGRAILVGGEPLEEEVLIWWNFVGHGKTEIAEAQRDWEAGSERFGHIPQYQGERLMPPPLPWKV